MDMRQRFIDGMSYAACTVNVVTTDGAAGRHGPHGFRNVVRIG